jgi:hypothetical protein
MQPAAVVQDEEVSPGHNVPKQQTGVTMGGFFSAGTVTFFIIESTHPQGILLESLNLIIPSENTVSDTV